MAKDEVTIVSAQVPTATRAELERRAQEGYRSLSGELRIAIDAHLNRKGAVAMANANPKPVTPPNPQPPPAVPPKTKITPYRHPR